MGTPCNARALSSEYRTCAQCVELAAPLRHPDSQLPYTLLRNTALTNRPTMQTARRRMIVELTLASSGSSSLVLLYLQIYLLKRFSASPYSCVRQPSRCSVCDGQWELSSSCSNHHKSVLPHITTKCVATYLPGTVGCAPTASPRSPPSSSAGTPCMP